MKYKRIIDLVGVVFLAVFLLPLILCIFILIRVSGSPVFFSQKRVGYAGQLFGCYKFRTMVVNSQEMLDEYLCKHPELREEWDKYFKLKNDPRITKVGGFLRKTSLDELPQLWNVLKGDMSLVGPRPVVVEELDRYYGEYAKDYITVRPGMTGLWQVSGRSETSYDERVMLDVWYIKNISPFLDVKILYKTFFVVLNGKGAF